jgi:hypothetical protein
MKFLLALCLVLAAMIVLRDSPTSREIDRILDRLHGDRIVKARGGITAVGDLRNYVTSNPIVYEVMHTTKTIVVPKGFVTDLASIPRLFRILLPRDDVYMLPAVIHDYLYWTQGCSRSEADSVLFLAMKEYEIDPFRRWIIYLGVRWFGAWAWRANSRLKDGGEKDSYPESSWTGYKIHQYPRKKLSRWCWKRPGSRTDWFSTKSRISM